MTDTTRLEELVTQISTLEAELYRAAIDTLTQEIRERFPAARGYGLERECDDGECWYWVYGVYTDWRDGRPVGDNLTETTDYPRDDEVSEALNEIASFIPTGGGASWFQVHIPPQEETDGQA